MKYFIPLFLSLLLTQISYAQNARAIALLKGVEQERLKCTRYRICYTEHRAEEGKTVQQIVDFEDGKIRKEHLKNEVFHGMMSLFLGDIVYVRTHYDGNDVGLVRPDSIHASGAGIYDARMLGLTDSMYLMKNIRNCLLYESRDHFSVKTSQRDGKNVNIVTCIDRDDTWEFFIEEPAFKVLKVRLTAPTCHIEVTSEYSNPSFLPFPTKVKIFRTDGDTVLFDKNITVTSVEFPAAFPPETFTIASFNLPLNSTVSDYRISRRIGFWDGEKLVDDPVKMSAQESREWEERIKNPPHVKILRLLMISAGGLMVCYALFSMWRKKTKP